MSNLDGVSHDNNVNVLNDIFRETGLLLLLLLIKTNHYGTCPKLSFIKIVPLESSYG